MCSHTVKGKMSQGKWLTAEGVESAEGVSAEIKNPPIIPWKEEDSGVE